MVSKGKGRETHLSLPEQIARLLVWVPEVWNKPGQAIQSRKSLATAADPILPEKGEGFQPQPEEPYIFFSLQVQCAFSRIRTVEKPREDTNSFSGVHSQAGGRTYLYLCNEGQHYCFTLHPASSMARRVMPSPLLGYGVGLLCLEGLSGFLSSKKPDAFPQRMLKSRSA